GGLRAADELALEALHLARAPAARVRPVRVLPPDVSLRVGVGLRRLRGAGRLAAASAARASGRALLHLHRALLDRTLRDRGAPSRQLLGGTVPRPAAREPGRRDRGAHRCRLDVSPVASGGRWLETLTQASHEWRKR